MKTLALITLFLPMFAAASQPANRVTVNKVDDWKVWISSHFPDSRSSWSEPCKNGLTKLQEDQKWDFVAAGDLTGHDIPAALGMNFGETFFETATAVKKLAVYLCQSGSWQESLSLDTRVIKLGGEKAASASCWIIRSSWLFGATGHNFLRTMLKLGAEREEVAVVDDQRGCPTYVGHLAEATRQVVELPFGIYHVAAEGECTWKEFTEAIFEEADLPCRVRAITTAELGRPAPRPAYSVLRSEKSETPRLPHWREGLRACLDELARNAR